MAYLIQNAEKLAKEQKDQERGGALPRLTACEQKKSL